jgi:hypothetical protein
MSRPLLKFFTAASLIFSSLDAQYLDEKPCFQELQTDFFRPDLVMEALSIHTVVQSQWLLITQSLKAKSKDIPSLLREKARRMELNGERNPLLYPFQPVNADKLLNEVLMEIFVDVLKDSNVTQPPFNIKEMFAYIRNKQAERIKACLGLDPQESQDQQDQQDLNLSAPTKNSLPK